MIQDNKRNLLHIELIRIIAAYFVIFNHTGKRGFFLFSVYERGSLQYWVYMILSIFCKISVPLFFMIAGALLLKKRYRIERNLVKENNENVGGVSCFFCGCICWTGNLERGRNLICCGLYREIVYESNFGDFLVFVCVYCIFDCTAIFKSYCKNN